MGDSHARDRRVDPGRGENSPASWCRCAPARRAAHADTDGLAHVAVADAASPGAEWRGAPSRAPDPGEPQCDPDPNPTPDAFWQWPARVQPTAAVVNDAVDSSGRPDRPRQTRDSANAS